MCTGSRLPVSWKQDFCTTNVWSKKNFWTKKLIILISSPFFAGSQKTLSFTLSLVQFSFSLFMYIYQMISFLFLMINTVLSATFPQGSKEIFQALLSQQLHLVHSVLAVLSVHHYLEESTVREQHTIFHSSFFLFSEKILCTIRLHTEKYVFAPSLLSNIQYICSVGGGGGGGL